MLRKDTVSVTTSVTCDNVWNRESWYGKVSKVMLDAETSHVSALYCDEGQNLGIDSLRLTLSLLESTHVSSLCYIAVMETISSI